MAGGVRVITKVRILRAPGAEPLVRELVRVDAQVIVCRSPLPPHHEIRFGWAGQPLHRALPSDARVHPDDLRALAALRPAPAAGEAPAGSKDGAGRRARARPARARE